VESEEPEVKLQSVAKAGAKANQSAKIRVRLGTTTRKRSTHHPNEEKKVCVGCGRGWRSAKESLNGHETGNGGDNQVNT
jgi:hypothetical protein